jgi:hypothetical protein
MTTKPNVMFHCPLDGIMDVECQTVQTIDQEHFVMNCGHCEHKTMIVRLR